MSEVHYEVIVEDVDRSIPEGMKLHALERNTLFTNRVDAVNSAVQTLLRIQSLNFDCDSIPPMADYVVFSWFGYRTGDEDMSLYIEVHEKAGPAPLDAKKY